MNDLRSILEKMALDKNIKTISIEMKRMSGGIKISCEMRVNDSVKMGLEFVNAKDFENDILHLDDAHDKTMNAILQACSINSVDSKKEE